MTGSIVVQVFTQHLHGPHHYSRHSLFVARCFVDLESPHVDLGARCLSTEAESCDGHQTTRGIRTSSPTTAVTGLMTTSTCTWSWSIWLAVPLRRPDSLSTTWIFLPAISLSTTSFKYRILDRSFRISGLWRSR